MNPEQTKIKLQTVQPEYVCPLCGRAGVTTSRNSLTFNYGSGKSMVELEVNVPVRHCQACDFEFLDEEAERLKHESVCQYLGVLSPAEIRQIREKFRMTRVRFAQVTGLGEASLNRWENGLGVQTYAYDRYLRLLIRLGNMRELEKLENSKLAPQTVSPPKRQFRALKLTDSMRMAQEDFQLHRVA